MLVINRVAKSIVTPVIFEENTKNNDGIKNLKDLLEINK